MKTIERYWNGMPTIVDYELEDGCMIENTLAHIGTIIIDKDFIDEMERIALELKDDKKLVVLLTNLYNKVKEYFSSNEINEKTRQETYFDNNVVDEDGLILGTKISSLKGKNVARCSEKSVAAYIILKKLYSMGAIVRKPSFVLSSLSTEKYGSGPHAFVMLDKDCDDPTKHLIFDIENPTLIEDEDKKKQYCVGIYSLKDEEYNDFLNGLSCSPISLYEIGSDYREISDKRTYGNVTKNKSL